MDVMDKENEKYITQPDALRANLLRRRRIKEIIKSTTVIIQIELITKICNNVKSFSGRYLIKTKFNLEVISS